MHALFTKVGKLYYVNEQAPLDLQDEVQKVIKGQAPEGNKQTIDANMDDQENHQIQIVSD
jgi:hypothetical protein